MKKSLLLHLFMLFLIFMGMGFKSNVTMTEAWSTSKDLKVPESVMYDQASEILSLFTERLRNDTLLRVATLDSIQPDALRELERSCRAMSRPRSASKIVDVAYELCKRRGVL